MTERPIIITNGDGDRYKHGDLLAVIFEAPGCYLAAKLEDAVARLEPFAYVVVKRECATKLRGVRIVHDEDIPDRTIRCEVRESGSPTNEMNDICEKCGRAYCDCEYKY
jgi:hypothetical protein